MGSGQLLVLQREIQKRGKDAMRALSYQNIFRWGSNWGRPREIGKDAVDEKNRASFV